MNCSDIALHVHMYTGKSSSLPWDRWQLERRDLSLVDFKSLEIPLLRSVRKMKIWELTNLEIWKFQKIGVVGYSSFIYMSLSEGSLHYLAVYACNIKRYIYIHTHTHTYLYMYIVSVYADNL